MCEEYLKLNHKDEFIKILQDADQNKHFSINIKFLMLFDSEPQLGNDILCQPETNLQKWQNAALSVQSSISKSLSNDVKYSIKNNVTIRIYGLPMGNEFSKSSFPDNSSCGVFTQFSGTVVRMTCTKMLEFQRMYICSKCKYPMIIKADYEKRNVITPLKKCENPETCPGKQLLHLGELNSDFCKDYQEIKVQEQVSTAGKGSMPSSIWVTLEDDLVDMCKPGDNITICGIVKRRWSQLILCRKIEIELVIKANHLQINNLNSNNTIITENVLETFKKFWEKYSSFPLAGRDFILKSFCPQIFGLHLVKLAIAVVLAGGSSCHDEFLTGVQTRSEPHLLLVGDPGTGKSHLLRFVSKVIPRSVLTTGAGSTAAGLTVTAVQEGGEWQLEAGALVLADGGVCCIDEFNSMREHDRTSIHEAMEQQTISVAKASIVCKLSTKCSIIAATNPKGGGFNVNQPLNISVNLASPLLSRFDLILLLRDTIDDRWDNLITDYVLNPCYNLSRLTEINFWSIELLQAYFVTIKKMNPMLTEDANLVLRTYYQEQRQLSSRNKSRTTVRLLDSLIRLSQGHARLMFHTEVQVVDAIMAVMLVETSLDTDTSILNLRFNVCDNFPENATLSYLELLETILKALHLDELLKKEFEMYKNSKTIDLNSRKQRSNYFQPKANSTENTELKEDADKRPEFDSIEKNVSANSTVETFSLAHNKDDVSDELRSRFSLNKTINQKITDMKKPKFFKMKQSNKPENTSITNNDFCPKLVLQENDSDKIETNNAKSKEVASPSSIEKRKSVNNRYDGSTELENVAMPPAKRKCLDGNTKDEQNKSKLLKLGAKELRKKSNHLTDDLQMLRGMPSINDDFCANLDLQENDFEQEIQSSFDIEMSKASQNSKQKIINKRFSFKSKEKFKFNRFHTDNNFKILKQQEDIRRHKSSDSCLQHSSTSIFESQEDVDFNL